MSIYLFEHSIRYLRFSHFISDHSNYSNSILPLLATTHIYLLTYSSSHLHIFISSLFKASTKHLRLRGLTEQADDVLQKDLQIYFEFALHRDARHGVCYALMLVCCARIVSLRSHRITALT